MLHSKHFNSITRHNLLNHFLSILVPRQQSFNYFYSSSKSSNNPCHPLISLHQKTITWDFKSIDTSSCKVDCLLIQNNADYNLKWLRKLIPQSQNILLADGGANIFYHDILQKGQYKQSPQVMRKIKGIIGDLDSITDDAKKFYLAHNVKLIRQTNQQKNDFEKTLLYGLSLGCENFIVSGAFGDRLDHTLSTMSITEHYIRKYLKINIVLSNSGSFYCPLSTGYKNKILLSSDISRQSCGLVTFQKVQNIETKGFKWDMGQGKEHCKIEWGKFLSTSNQILGEEVMVETKNIQDGVIYFIGRFSDANNE